MIEHYLVLVFQRTSKKIKNRFSRLHDNDKQSAGMVNNLPWKIAIVCERI